jgi:hypothetical protein
MHFGVWLVLAIKGKERNGEKEKEKKNHTYIGQGERQEYFYQFMQFFEVYLIIQGVEIA